MSWTLVIFIYAGMMSDADDVALTNIPGFHSEQACENAALVSNDMVSFTAKHERCVCLKID